MGHRARMQGVLASNLEFQVLAWQTINFYPSTMPCKVVVVASLGCLSDRNLGAIKEV